MKREGYFKQFGTLLAKNRFVAFEILELSNFLRVDPIISGFEFQYLKNQGFDFDD